MSVERVYFSSPNNISYVHLVISTKVKREKKKKLQCILQSIRTLCGSEEDSNKYDSIKVSYIKSFYLYN
jgi:hypothetical protein